MSGASLYQWPVQEECAMMLPSVICNGLLNGSAAVGKGFQGNTPTGALLGSAVGAGVL